MTSPRLIASAIVVSGLWLAPHARADDRSRPDAPPTDDEPAHVVVRPPGETPPAPPVPDVTPSGKREPTGTFSIGAGYNSDEGFLARADIAQPRLFGTGHGLSMSALISALRQDFVIAYNTPTFGDGWDLRAELYTRRRVRDAFARDSVGGTLTLGKQLDRNTRAYLRYRAEHVTITPEGQFNTSDIARRLTGSLGDGFVSALGAGIAWDTRDVPMLATRGSRLELYAEAANRDLGSDYQFLKVSAAGDHARPLGPFTLRLAGRATYITSRDPGGVPLSERLFHDGHADIRGYRLGSFDDRGANFEALGRVELELPVWKRAGLSIAGFFDAGMRTNEDAAWGPIGSTLHRSVGMSVIWRSPIGPLRLDVAFPLDGADRDRKVIFGIGFPF